MSVKVKYNDTIIASLEEGQIATLFTKSKKMESDIMVTVSQSESSEIIKEYDGTVVISDKVDLITFTIDDTEYQAEKNMTWAEWCESEYNTGGFGQYGPHLYISTSAKPDYYIYFNGTYMKFEDTLIKNIAYITQYLSYSGGGEAD